MARQLTVQDIDRMLSTDGVFTGLLQCMAEGGDELKYCKEIKIEFAYVQDWIWKDAMRIKAYEHASKLYDRWFVYRLIDELKAIGLVDVAGAFNADGTLKAIQEIPENVRRSIAGIEVQETFEDLPAGGKKWTGYLKKVKMTDKLKAIELIGKKLSMFVDKIQVDVSGTVVHTVDKFDLDERLKLLRQPRATSPEPVARIEVEEAVILKTSNKAGNVEHTKPGSDI